MQGSHHGLHEQKLPGLPPNVAGEQYRASSGSCCVGRPVALSCTCASICRPLLIVLPNTVSWTAQGGFAGRRAEGAAVPAGQPGPR